MRKSLFNEILPTGWSIKRVDQIKAPERYACVAGPFGSNISSKYFTETGVPVIRGGNLSDGTERFIPENFVFVSEDKARSFPGQHVKAGDLVFTCWGTLGQVGLIPSNGPFNEYIISNKQLKLRPNLKLCDKDYLFYYFTLPQMIQHINDIAIGAAVPGINLGLLKRIKVVLPPLPTQRKIAAILTAYDDLIETNKRRIALLEKMTEELYREWFVRMRFPGHQDTKFVKGVPEGWEQKRFGEFCMLKRGYDLPNASVEDGPYPVVASTSVKTFHKHYKAEPPVITTGRSGSLGDVLITHSRAWPLNTALYVRKFFGNSPFLVFYTLKNMGLEKFNSGAGVPTLNRNHVNGIPIAVPDKNLQQRFDGFVEPMHKQAENFRLANLRLSQTRDLLLPRLISGKLSVEDLDIQFPPSMQKHD